MDKVNVIVLAGGCGERMGYDLPKQLLVLDDGIRVLDLTLSAYEALSDIDAITVVYNDSYSDIFFRTCRKYHKVSHMVAGGSTRQQSLRNGLIYADSKFILIHDAARPIVCDRAVKECIEKLRSGSQFVHTIFQSYATMIIVKDKQVVNTIDRSDIAEPQCPVGFRQEILIDSLAYATSMGREFKDDISMVRFANLYCKIDLVEGHQNGFKITYPEDIDFLRTYLFLKGKK
jgi:2-C-methyl-D-erythritol 4-phosphate cytidylyltransferase